jgi:uncharacterized protein YkuJ
MKPILLLAGVMLFIIITGCSKSNPTKQKNFDLGQTKVAATEYFDENGKLFQVILEFQTRGKVFGGRMGFDTNGVPMIYGTVTYNLDDLRILMEVMETYRPSSRPPKG